MTQVTISKKEIYWILNAFETLDKMSTALYAVPMTFKPEVSHLLNRLRAAVRNQENNPNRKN